MSGGRVRPAPQPERREPRLSDPRLRDLTFADWKAIVVRGFKGFLDDNAMMLASALAYSSFFAIPAVLIVATGLFTLIAGPNTIETLMQQLSGVVPGQATELLGGSLKRADASPGSSILMTIFGFVVAVWSVTGAMNAYMLALNLRTSTRTGGRFCAARRRAEDGRGDRVRVRARRGAHDLRPGRRAAIGRVSAPRAACWTSSGGWCSGRSCSPACSSPSRRCSTSGRHGGAQVAVPDARLTRRGAALDRRVGALRGLHRDLRVVQQDWGALSAVIVTLTWLWLTGMALLLGGEINAEVERSRRLRAA